LRTGFVTVLHRRSRPARDETLSDRSFSRREKRKWPRTSGAQSWENWRELTKPVGATELLWRGKRSAEAQRGSRECLRPRKQESHLRVIYERNTRKNRTQRSRMAHPAHSRAVSRPPRKRNRASLYRCAHPETTNPAITTAPAVVRSSSSAEPNSTPAAAGPAS